MPTTFPQHPLVTIPMSLIPSFSIKADAPHPGSPGPGLRFSPYINKKFYSTVAGNAFSVHLLRLLDYQEMAGWLAASGSKGPVCTQREAEGKHTVPVPMTLSLLLSWHASLSLLQHCPCVLSLCLCTGCGAKDAEMDLFPFLEELGMLGASFNKPLLLS